MFEGITSAVVGGLLIFAQFPSSSTYRLHDYSIGTGGTSGSTSGSYMLEGVSGEVSGTQAVGGSYRTNSGFINTQQANVPPAPTFTNDGNWYNKLHFIISTGNNPSDAIFAIAISSDDFVTTNYIQNDNTVGPALGMEDRQTYAQWGSGSGEDVIGLNPNTTYKIKVNAMHGNFTESPFGPTATASTVGSQLSFSINTDSQPTPPFSIALGTLTASTVTTSADHINVTMSTNAANGGNVYIYNTNSGLDSASTSDTIPSATADLSGTSGYGSRSTADSETSGGPFTAQSPYAGSGDNVGIMDTLIRTIYSTATPVTTGSGSFVLKARPTTLTKAASDYTDTITLIAAANF